MEKIKTGTLVTPTADCLSYYNVTEDHDDLIVPEGRVVIENDFTGMRFFASAVGERRWLAAWGCYVRSVRLENITTVVLDGAIWGVVGEQVKGRKWLVRDERVEAEPPCHLWCGNCTAELSPEEAEDSAYCPDCNFDRDEKMPPDA